MTEPLHRQDFPVHSYDVDAEGFLAPRALFAFLQEAAGGDAARGGYTMERLAEEELVWVIQWMRVEVERYPRRGETLDVTTWARRLERVVAWREFDVVDGSGARLAVGTSRWAVVEHGAGHELARAASVWRRHGRSASGSGLGTATVGEKGAVSTYNGCVLPRGQPWPAF